MILTREAIHAAASQGGGWSRAQLSLLGVSWPPQRGWLSRLIGTAIPDGTYAQFLALKSKPRILTAKRAKNDTSTPDLFASDSPEAFANGLYESDPESFS